MVKRVKFSEISPSEFFYRNRDLAGFTNPSRSLYSAVREFVENSLDACDEAGILPEIRVELSYLEEGRYDPQPYRLVVEDNGMGIDPRHLPDAFGRVFFGSKFLLKQARGMFGMGGTMAILYSQITTNRPAKVSSSVDGVKRYSFKLLIDIYENRPIIIERRVEPAERRGTRIEVSLYGDYTRAEPKITEYIRQTSLITPYATLHFKDPKGRELHFERVTVVMPKPPSPTKPHPHGIDVEALRRMIRLSKERTLLKFMSSNFHRVGEKTASAFLEFAGFDKERDPKTLDNEELVRFVEALRSYNGFLKPDSSCLSPVGEEILRAGIMKSLEPEFLEVVSRPPSAYSGYPFIIEAGLAYNCKGIEGLKLYRYANRVPLLYDEYSDVVSKVVNDELDLRRYGVKPNTSLAIITHICSTKVPYKTVGKEFVADRPEIERELKNALRELLRRLRRYLGRKRSYEMVRRRMNIYGKYLPLLARFSKELSGMKRMPRYRSLLKEGELVEERHG